MQKGVVTCSARRLSLLEDVYDVLPEVSLKSVPINNPLRLLVVFKGSHSVRNLMFQKRLIFAHFAPAIPVPAAVCADVFEIAQMTEFFSWFVVKRTRFIFELVQFMFDVATELRLLLFYSSMEFRILFHKILDPSRVG